MLEFQQHAAQPRGSEVDREQRRQRFDAVRRKFVDVALLRFEHRHVFAFGEHQTDATLQAAETKSVRIVSLDHFNPADLSVAAQVAHIKAADAQAVLIWTTGTPFGTALRAMKDTDTSLPTLTTNSNMTYAQMNAYEG